jgi:voltage-gated potassium channel
MIAGIALLGVVTATLASWLVERVSAENTDERTATAAQVDALMTEVRAPREHP